MKNLILTTLALFLFGLAQAQTKIRQGDGTSTSNRVLYTVDGQKVHEGAGTSSSNKVLYTFDGVKFRQGNGTSTSNQVLLTIDGNKIRQKNFGKVFRHKKVIGN